MSDLTETEILDALKDRSRVIYGWPKQIYFDMRERGLISLTEKRIDSQETGVLVSLSE